MMSKGDPIFLSKEKLAAVLEDQRQILITSNFEGEDVLINKAHIVQSQIDKVTSAKASKLPDPDIQKRIEATKDRYDKQE